MKTRITSIVVCLSLFAPAMGRGQGAMGSLDKRDPTSAAMALDGRPWFRPTTAKRGSEAKISKEDIYEVPASLTLVAIKKLEVESGVVPLTEEEARGLAGGHYECPKGKKPFLIRAIYVARGGGDCLTVTRVADGQVYVGQELLGYTSHALLKTALIINVDFEVTYVGTGVIFMG